MAVELYKRGQGKYTRGITFAVGSLIGLVTARYVYGLLEAANLNIYVAFGAPVAILVGVAVLMYWLVNRPTSADFMIATEGEMKKVSWSSRREVVGGTKVVIVTTLVLAVLLWAVDLAFAFFFSKISVLQVGG